MINTKSIIPFEIYVNKILNKDPSKILLELFPKLSHPSQSRFNEFFKKLKELNKIGIDEINVIKWLLQLANLNYIFVPKDEFSNKILGFAFINVCNYMDILQLLKRLTILENNNNTINNENFINNNRKKIEVIYSHKQGLKSLTKSFGVSHIF